MDRRYAGNVCECGDPFCAGCGEPEFSDADFDRDFHRGEQDDPAGDELADYYAQPVECPVCRQPRGPDEWTEPRGHCDDCEATRLDRLYDPDDLVLDEES